MDYSVILDLLGSVFALGSAFYLGKIAQVLKGGMLARGMTIIAASPLLVALSAVFELLSQLGFGEVYGIIHDLMRLAFIFVLLAGARLIVVAWSKLP